MTAAPDVINIYEGACPHCGTNGTAILAALAAINGRLDTIMSNQAEEISLAQAIETQIAAISASVTTLNSEIAALQAAAANGEPLDFSALQQAVTDLTTAAGSVAASATAAAPPAAPAAPAG